MLRQVSKVAMGSPAKTYLSFIARRIAAIRADVPRLTRMGEKMAGAMLDGGHLFNPPVAPYWPHEFGGRAGGFMGIRNEKDLHELAKNVAYFALPGAPDWNPHKDETLANLLNGKAKLFVVGREDELKGVGKGRIAGFTGGADPDEGFYAYKSRRPLASSREFEQFVRGWIAAGELFGACTRAGKTPSLWMSVWLEGALPRNAHFFKHNNLREPWDTPFFHDGHYVPPLPTGYVADAFLNETERLHRLLIEQASELAQAGEWIAQALRNRKRVWTVAVGHSYPQNLEIDSKRPHPLEWGPSFSDLTKALPEDLGKGDVALHFGYAPVNADHVKSICARGIRLIHTSPYGPSFKPLKHPNFLYFDLPWRPADATVDIPGYSVRLLPMSSTAQTMALFAILSETAERMGWK